MHTSPNPPLPSQSDVDKVAVEEELAFVSRRLREYETGEYGLGEAVAEIKRRKEDIALRDRWERGRGREGWGVGEKWKGGRVGGVGEKGKGGRVGRGEREGEEGRERRGIREKEDKEGREERGDGRWEGIGTGLRGRSR